MMNYPEDRAPRPRLGLIHYTDERGERRLVNLSKDVFTIGRMRDNDLTIDNHLISRYHAEIIFNGSGYTYVDKSSRCGSFIRHERIVEKSLRDGDIISLGSEERGTSLTFFFPQLGAERKPGRPPQARPSESAPGAPQAKAGRAEEAAVSLTLLNEISRQLLSCGSSAEIVERLLDGLGALPLGERVAILLYDPRRSELRLSGSRAPSGQMRVVEPHEELIARVCSQNAALIGYDHQHQEFFLSAPVASARHVWGVCHLTSGDRAFHREELEFLTALGHQAGLALEIIHLLEEQCRTCESFIHALALSIDARDEMTAGHSARVADHAAAIARHLHLPLREQRLTYYAALLHDYGKIGIRDAVLCKPSQLTPEEYEKIKQHPLYTLNILSKINFGEDLASVPFVASSHHERPDGAGYPRGLSRDEIPIGARIIAVADFFDALTVARHYRGPIPAEEALALIEAGRDTQFDGEVIDAFHRYFCEEYLPRRAQMAAGDE
jgi:HD-GYP domain-containing protein (c-di-GMP phosphodiesterase class II)